MSDVVNPAIVFDQADRDKLLEEIGRYLAAVDLFRAVGCEPHWRPERETRIGLEQSLSDRREHPVVH